MSLVSRTNIAQRMVMALDKCSDYPTQTGCGLTHSVRGWRSLRAPSREVPSYTTSRCGAFTGKRTGAYFAGKRLPGKGGLE